MLCCLVASAFAKKGSRPKLDDFMLRFEERRKSPAAIMATLRMASAAHEEWLKSRGNRT